MKTYEMPEIQIETFEIEDIITESAGGGTPSDENDTGIY